MESQSVICKLLKSS